MWQIVQSLRTGQIDVVEVPSPARKPGHLICRTRRSLISIGTERMLLKFGRSGWLDKARQQPDKVRQVLDKLRTDGLLETWTSVRSKLDQPLALGYCSVGSVLEAGPENGPFRPGDRVVSNGQHAEVVCVPRNLCAKIPDTVTDDAAAFTVVGAIGLEGIRLAEPTLGETFVVLGAGLIGLLTVQMLRAQGCRVLAADFNPRRLALAREFGAEGVDLRSSNDLLAAAMDFSRGRGADGVLITASTRSDQPIRQAAAMCRKRGRIVLVGQAGLRLSRADFYEKELSFQVSCSYGPGRYDRRYEQEGHDYPVQHARWTAQRNFEAVLDLMAEGRLVVEPLVSHRFAHADAQAAYDVVGGRDSEALGMLLDYPTPALTSDAELTQTTVEIADRLPVTLQVASKNPQRYVAEIAPRIGFIGAGAFACRTLIPAFRAAGAQLEMVASQSGTTAASAARRFGFRQATSDVNAVLDDPAIDGVIIATRHDSHAQLVCEALRRGKHVFVEKPLALTFAQLADVSAAWQASHAGVKRPTLAVGFNRRFAPHVRQLMPLLHGSAASKCFVMTVNAGKIAPDAWVHDVVAGGGRILGEACHFIDLLRCLCGQPIESIAVTPLHGGAAEAGLADSVTITMSFADGSIGTIHYLANGHRAVAKERLEIYCDGRIAQLDNFRRLRTFGWNGVRGKWLWRQDKGHQAGVAAFLQAVRGVGPPSIPVEELFETSRWTLNGLKSLETGRRIANADEFPVVRDGAPAVPSFNDFCSRAAA